MKILFPIMDSSVGWLLLSRKCSNIGNRRRSLHSIFPCWFQKCVKCVSKTKLFGPLSFCRFSKSRRFVLFGFATGGKKHARTASLGLVTAGGHRTNPSRTIHPSIHPSIHPFLQRTFVATAVARARHRCSVRFVLPKMVFRVPAQVSLGSEGLVVRELARVSKKEATVG